MARTRRSQGLTLIEVLVTTVLLGLVSAALLGMAGGEQHERTQLRSLVRELRGLDARARLVARTGEAVELSVDDAARSVVVRVARGTAPIAERTLPPEAKCSIRRDRVHPVRRISYDSTGASGDYTLDIALGHHQTRLDIAGLTGWITETEASP